MNRVILHGNVGNDPDSKVLQSGNTVTKFSLATNKSYTDKKGEKITETQWHSIVLWGKVAETASKYVKKGSSLIVEGEIAYRSYVNKEGQTVYITEIIGSNMHFAGSKESKEPKAEAPQAQEKWHGKQPVKSLSNIDDLPQHVQDAEASSNEMDELPY
jgi:single-strand DNA-binding protein